MFVLKSFHEKKPIYLACTAQAMFWSDEVEDSSIFEGFTHANEVRAKLTENAPMEIFILPVSLLEEADMVHKIEFDYINQALVRVYGGRAIEEDELPEIMEIISTMGQFNFTESYLSDIGICISEGGQLNIVLPRKLRKRIVN